VRERVGVRVAASRTAGHDVDRLFTEPQSGTLLTSNNQLVLGDSVISPTDTNQVTRYHLAPQSNLTAEGGVRIGDLWIAGGAVRRGPTTLVPPALLGDNYPARTSWRVEDAATAATISARGRLFKALYADVWAIRWNDTTGLYRPQIQTSSELYIQTNLLDKFPRGNFGLLGSLTHEYRSRSLFPLGDSLFRVVPGYRLLTFKLEIRIQTAVVSYQFRNLMQEKYAQVPGFLMPRQSQFYGIRWDFWN
jgi:hypothetical protein